MIERIGKAIYDNMCLANPHVMTTWETLPYDLKTYYREQGRAAIEAMRKPTDEMLAAGDSMMPQIAKGQDVSTGLDALAEAWPTMIDAALAVPSHQRSGE